MTNCAKIVHTKTNEASKFWNKRVSPITMTSNEYKMRNACKQKNEFAWFLKKQMQKQAKNQNAMNLF